MPRGGPLQYTYLRGFAAPNDAAAAEKYLVALDDKTGKFYMVEKGSVRPTRMIRTIFARPPTWALDLCHDSEGCSRGAACPKLHVSKEPMELHISDEREEMLVCLKNGTNTRLSVKQMIPTAGLKFVSTLKEHGLVTEIYPWVCQRFLKGTCPSGPKCLALHVDPSLVKDIQRAPIESTTTIATALQSSLPKTPGLQAFIDTTLHRIGLVTIGDMAGLSNTVFEAVMNRDIEASPHNRQFWLLVVQQRSINTNAPIVQALLQFPGIDTKVLESVAHLSWLNTVTDLLSLRPKVLYSLPMRAQVLDACEKLRARFEDEREVYSQIILTELPPNAFFRRMAQLVCDFRHKHAHKSWRKQDATRPIVTSLITYVDPDECCCSVEKATMASTASTGGGHSTLSTKSPCHGPSRGAAVPALPPPLTPLMAGGSTHSDPTSPARAAGRPDEVVPSRDHWCQCRRQYELAVNYELSTPSGSRCSEQNALGCLASKGLPTTCIREVFVHGGVHNSEDPNPLFPCGVCENMFRRVSKDVQKKHGGDVMLYMFDQETNPRKLVSIPVAEISHREGSSFKKFVNEDVREDWAGGSTAGGTLTPRHSFLGEDVGGGMGGLVGSESMGHALAPTTPRARSSSN